MRYSSRLFLYAPLFVLLALAVAAGLRWRAVSGGLQSWLQQHNGQEIARGVTLRFESETVGGFPFNVDAVLRNVTLAVKSARTSGSWHTDGFAIHELTFGRAQQIYESAGRQTLSWRDAEGGSHRIVFIPGSLMASAILSRGRLVRFDLDLQHISSREVSGARVQLHFRKAPVRDAIDIVASADQLHLAPALQAGFGADLRSAEINGSLVPAPPFAALFEARDTWDHAFEGWRQNRGVFHLDKLAFTWNGVQIRASGSLGLDSAHRLEGTLGLDVDGQVNTYAAGNLAHAIAQLTKVTRKPSQRLSLMLISGAVNLEVTNPRRMIARAGSIGPLY